MGEFTAFYHFIPFSFLCFLPLMRIIFIVKITKLRLPDADHKGELPMIFDCHLHTAFSGDSNTPARLQIERAISLGMKELTVTDHHDYDSSFCEDDFELDLLPYLTALRDLREEYRDKIRINIGIELGLQLHIQEYLEQFHREWGAEFDFIIGSSHFIRSQDPYYPSFWENCGSKKGLEDFFDLSLKRVRALHPVFDSWGHLDYAARYAPDSHSVYSYSAFKEPIDSILKVLIQTGKALECNTGGLRSSLGQPNPDAEILKQYRRMGGELITIGSDAHIPEHLGYGFDRIRELLKQCGFHYYTIYHNRKAEMIPL